MEHYFFINAPWIEKPESPLTNQIFNEIDISAIHSFLLDTKTNQLKSISVN
jgi:hypothetical protein